MRPLEIALCLATAPLLVWSLSGRAMPAAGARVWAALGLLVLALQVTAEGPRWHLGPAYLLAIYLFVVCSWPRAPALGPGRWAGACGMGLLATAALLGTVLPVFRLPDPTGAHSIGTVILHLVDLSRQEPHCGPPGHRELMIQVWYPAQSSGPGVAYSAPAETSFKKQHLTLVRTHAVRGAPVASGRPQYPVVICAPSWTGRRNQNTVQAEEMASHGFIVVGIDHPYGTELTRFPDGRAVRTTLGAPLDYSTDEALARSVRAAEAELRVRAADVRFVLDELERLDRSDPAGLLTGRVDTSRVGIFGHSFGGAVAAEVCRTDARVKAGANLDGLIFGEAMKGGFRKPFLVLDDGTRPPSAEVIAACEGPVRRELTFLAENVQSIRRGLTAAGGCWVTVHGTSHMNFCDSPLYSPLRRLTGAGPIRRERAMEIINASLLWFFQARLNGEDDHGLESLAARYPEVEYKRISKDTF